MSEIINLSLLLFLSVLAVTIARLRNLFAVVMIAGFYSLVSAALFTVLDAVDVAFTEAAVGAGISTVILNVFNGYLDTFKTTRVFAFACLVMCLTGVMTKLTALK